MTRASYEPGAFDQGDRMRRLDAELAKPERTLKRIGAVMVAESLRAFREQRFGATAWRARNDVNVFGILADFAAGKREPPKRRFENRPALRDTGRLSKSIAFEVVDEATAVEVGTTVEYAAVHHFGGPTKSVEITADVQTALGRWLDKLDGAADRTQNKIAKELAKAGRRTDTTDALAEKMTGQQRKAVYMRDKLGWLLSPHLRDTQLEAIMPARPFVGFSSQTRRNVERAVGVSLVREE